MSNAFTNMPQHSGTGRIARVRMSTMTLHELGISDGSASLAALFAGKQSPSGAGKLSMAEVADLIVRGGWPAAIDLSTASAQQLTTSYIEGVCGSDASRIDGARRDPDKLMALVRSLARNESTLASTNSIITDLGGEASRQTVYSYLDVLTRLNFIENVPAWSPMLRSPAALRQAQKRHLADPSLAAAALGADINALLNDTKTLGLLFESLVIHDLIVYARAIDARVFHYHDAAGLEADAIVQKRNGDWMPLEIKLSAGGVEKGCASLARVERKIVEAGGKPPVAKLIVVGFGELAHTTEDEVQVIPVDMLGA